MNQAGTFKIYFAQRTNGTFEIDRVDDFTIEIEVTESTDYNLLIGIFFSIALGIGLLIVTHEPIAMIGGTSMSLFAFSSPAMGAFQFLPQETPITRRSRISMKIHQHFLWLG